MGVLGTGYAGKSKTLKRKNKGAKKNRAALWVFFFFAVISITAVCCYLSYNYVVGKAGSRNEAREITISPGEGIYVEIPRGAGTSAIAEILKEKGIIKNTYIFRLLSMINGYDSLYRSGTHILSDKLSYEDVMRVLSSNPITVKVTIPEGYNVKQIAEVLEKKGLADEDKFFDALSSGQFDYKFLKDLPKRDNRLEGYLFPDTYEFDLKAGEKEIIDRMLANFNAKFKPEYYEKAKSMGMTVDQIVILASIIEREARRPEETDKIAGVFYNRLKSKDQTLRRLQSCATIQYIFYMREGTVKEKITEADTKVESPYNTYIIEGLPPGPICCPGENSIKSALFPEEHDYLYFVARGDGTHEFSRTYAEHQAAQRKYGVR